MRINILWKPIILTIIGLFFSLTYSQAETNSSGRSLSEKTHLNLKIGAVFGVSTISMIKMFKEKPFLGDNVSAEYQTIKSPDQVAAKTISGELDMVMVASNLGAKLYSKGVPYKLAGVMVWGNLYIVSSEDIHGWKDLKGKEIYMHARGLTPDFVLQHLLRENGLDPKKDVKIHYLTGGPQALAMSFLGGKSVVSMMPEPMLGKVLLRKKDTHIVIDIQKEWQKATKSSRKGFPQGALLIKNEIIEKYPEVVETFLKNYEESIIWMNANPAKAGQYAEALNIGLKAKPAEKGIPGCNLRYVDAIDAKPELNTLFSILYKYNPKAVGGKMPDDGLYFQR